MILKLSKWIYTLMSVLDEVTPLLPVILPDLYIANYLTLVIDILLSWANHI